MAKLLYIANLSLDGYSADRHGGIDWGSPDEEYFGVVNDIQRPVRTYLYGRRMYEAMVYWESAPIADQPSWVAEFTRTWRAADKVVYSTTLTTVSSRRTTLERELDVEAVRRMKAAATGDLTIGGAEVAAHAFEAGLVDECHLLFWPIVLGGGKPALPRHRRLHLQLLHQQRTAGGVAHLHYRTVR